MSWKIKRGSIFWQLSGRWPVYSHQYSLFRKEVKKVLYIIAFLIIAATVAIVSATYCTWNWMDMCREEQETEERDD